MAELSIRVVIPASHAERMPWRVVDSVLAHTLPRDEITPADDGEPTPIRRTMAKEISQSA
jgi:hypothetical protein